MRPTYHRAFVLTALATLSLAAPSLAARAPAATLIIRGAGDGHGVGMSQDGALGFAQHGYSYAAILAHYYTGTALGQAPPRWKVRVLVGGKVRKVPLETYVRGVVANEMSPELAARRARGASYRQPHLRAHRPQRQRRLRRLLRHPLAGLPRPLLRNAAIEPRGEGHRGTDRHLRRPARHHLLLRLIRRDDRKHPIRFPGLCPRALAAGRARSFRCGAAAQLEQESRVWRRRTGPARAGARVLSRCRSAPTGVLAADRLGCRAWVQGGHRYQRAGTGLAAWVV